MENDVMKSLNELTGLIEERKKEFIDKLISSLDAEKQAEALNVWNALNDIPKEIETLSGNLNKIGVMESSMFESKTESEENTLEEVTLESENDAELVVEDAPVQDEKAEEVAEEKQEEVVEETPQVEESVVAEVQPEVASEEVVEEAPQAEVEAEPAVAETPQVEETAEAVVEVNPEEQEQIIQTSDNEPKAVLVNNDQRAKLDASFDTQNVLQAEINRKTEENTVEVPAENVAENDTVVQLPIVPEAPAAPEANSADDLEKMVQEYNDELNKGNEEKANEILTAINEAKGKTLQKAA